MADHERPPEKGGTKNPGEVDPWTAEAPPERSGSGKAKPEQGSGEWERDMISRLAFASLKEQRTARRWNLFFKGLFFVYLLVLLFLYMPKTGSDTVSEAHTAVVEVKGVIAQDAVASADSIITGLRAAYEAPKVKGIILRINSPGGSPVQSSYVYDEIMRLKAEHPDKPIYAVISDLGASAAYYIAAATDEIYANRASMVGSIGVLMDGYGFVGTLEKLGVERRLLTAGENKGFLDPFSPVEETHKRHMRGILTDVHDQFIKAVKDGRGDRLKNDPKLFSGLVWTGTQSVEMGLVDGLGSSSYVARELIGAEKIVDYTPKQNILDRLAERVGVATANALSSWLMSPGLK